MGNLSGYLATQKGHVVNVIPTSCHGAFIFPLCIVSDSSVGHSSNFEAVVSVFSHGMDCEALFLFCIWSIYRHCHIMFNAMQGQVVLRGWLSFNWYAWFTVSWNQLCNDVILFKQAWNRMWWSPPKCHIVRCDLRDGEESRGSRNCQETTRFNQLFTCGGYVKCSTRRFDYLILKGWKLYSLICLLVLQSLQQLQREHIPGLATAQSLCALVYGPHVYRIAGLPPIESHKKWSAH